MGGEALLSFPHSSHLGGVKRLLRCVSLEGWIGQCSPGLSSPSPSWELACSQTAHALTQEGRRGSRPQFQGLHLVQESAQRCFSPKALGKSVNQYLRTSVVDQALCQGPWPYDHKWEPTWLHQGVCRIRGLTYVKNRFSHLMKWPCNWIKKLWKQENKVRHNWKDFKNNQIETQNNQLFDKILFVLFARLYKILLWMNWLNAICMFGCSLHGFNFLGNQSTEFRK